VPRNLEITQLFYKPLPPPNNIKKRRIIAWILFQNPETGEPTKVTAELGLDQNMRESPTQMGH